MQAGVLENIYFFDSISVFFIDISMYTTSAEDSSEKQFVEFRFSSSLLCYLISITLKFLVTQHLNNYINHINNYL